MKSRFLFRSRRPDWSTPSRKMPCMKAYISTGGNNEIGWVNRIPATIHTVVAAQNTPLKDTESREMKGSGRGGH
ncbi:hypothetical protein ATL31_0546 [Phycicoccus duodecadis]|uniref:Uncharacterized protein n=1 Tax=Phycicoccus duodecadis TaxID=173053 RepID=A0A2N3YFY1_9MICO|nr:hypothetical protein ATL31_0546 [Phycicoccus duodecadis]